MEACIETMLRLHTQLGTNDYHLPFPPSVAYAKSLRELGLRSSQPLAESDLQNHSHGRPTWTQLTVYLSAWLPDP